MTKKEQAIQNARIRIAIRTGELPYSFTDAMEKSYRKIIYETGKEIGRKLTVRKSGENWVINFR